MNSYLVGGAVRDKLLGLPVTERDWVVVGATPPQLLAAGYSQVGKDFPVFLHPQTKEQYALARLERKTSRGHQGFAFDTTGRVTLEQDLARRDLTINAMAEDEQGKLIDPYGGQQDLQRRVLRHVSAAFAEDPLRVLRVARFAARFHDQGFTVAPETMALMQRMSGVDGAGAASSDERSAHAGGGVGSTHEHSAHASTAERGVRASANGSTAAGTAAAGTDADGTDAAGTDADGTNAASELVALPGERVWQEIHRALQTSRPDIFISVLRDCKALRVLLPEVDRLFGVPQPARYHPEIDTGLHLLLCLQQIAQLTDDPIARYATLTHDLGKGLTDPTRWPSHRGHEELGLQALATLQQRIPVPKEYAAMAKLVAAQHTNLHRALELRPTTLLRLLERLDAFRRPHRLLRFRQACEADSRGRTGLEAKPYPQSNYLQQVYKAARNIDIPALLAAHKNQKPEVVIRTARLQQIEQVVTAHRAG